MRKLLNTLYITSEDLFLSYSNGNVVVNRGDEITARFPLLNLDGIITFSYAGATPALMGGVRQAGHPAYVHDTQRQVSCPGKRNVPGECIPPARAIQHCR